MDEKKRKHLEAQGWQVGDAGDFLELTQDEVAYIETKFSLARGLRAERERQGLTQTQVADRIGSSQSRVARMEAGDGSVSIDLLIRSLLKLGVERGALAELVRPREGQRRKRTKAGTTG